MNPFSFETISHKRKIKEASTSHKMQDHTYDWQNSF